MKIVSSFGKLLFPRLPHDLRRRRTANFLITLSVGLVVAGLVAFTMLKLERVAGH
jgi:hypothetical protein